MKIAAKTNVKKQKQNKKPIMKSKKEQVMIVAQEIKFARFLSSNEKKTRDKALKTLKKWLVNCLEKGYEFKESDFSRIWKGLFYAVWMSDKPLVQEELCENIAGMLELFPPEAIKQALLLVKVGFNVLAKEWYGIDHHRMDKCLMLFRRYLRGSFGCILRCGWSIKSCRIYSNMLGAADGLLALKTPQFAKNSMSLILHLLDIYLEEISKVSKGDIPEESLTELLRPICAYMCSGTEPTLCASARKLLTQLMKQSDLAFQYQEKTNAWKSMGCPPGGPDALEPASDDEEDENAEEDEQAKQSDDEFSGPLDPRAGRVDVSLCPLRAPAARLGDMLADMLAGCTSKAYKRVKLCMDRFKELSKNSYPLKLELPPMDENQPQISLTQSAQSLHSLEKQLIASSDELALRGLKRKHRKRLLAKSRAGMSIVEDLDEVSAVSTESANGDWKIEDTEPEKKKKKLNENNKKIQKVKTDKHTRIGDIKKQTTPQINAVSINGTQKKEKVKTQKLKVSKITTDLTKNVVIKKTHNKASEPSLKLDKVKHYSLRTEDIKTATPKKVKFVLKNNSMQEPVEYYQSVKMSPNIPFDSCKKPNKANLKPSTPSPINPFFKKRLLMRK